MPPVKFSVEQDKGVEGNVTSYMIKGIVGLGFGYLFHFVGRQLRHVKCILLRQLSIRTTWFGAVR